MKRFSGFNKRLWMISAVLAVLGLLIAGPTSAAAHGRRILHGRDIATVAPDHKSGSVCDEEQDGHFVYAEWALRFGGTVREADGGDRNCDNSPVFPRPAFAFRLCEATRGRLGNIVTLSCTRWYRT
jgi:hypothetical protein